MNNTAPIMDKQMTKDTRIETDSIGEVEVPADAYYGAQTQRSLQNFDIGTEKNACPYRPRPRHSKESCGPNQHRARLHG